MCERQFAEREELVKRGLMAYDWNLSDAARFLGTYPGRVRAVIKNSPELTKLWEANRHPKPGPKPQKLPEGVT